MLVFQVNLDQPDPLSILPSLVTEETLWWFVAQDVQGITGTMKNKVTVNNHCNKWQPLRLWYAQLHKNITIHGFQQQQWWWPTPENSQFTITA